ncbi:PREDICTED: little elongation complex subunit 2-like [Dinoponera quadriceps]|uniref:Little elongation complex subunit 2-like n=1 Tax=Dinoponera quadriceps TaxID=609295 RepID=A0A6P3XNH5_DINQU|nr:PREDICTED: little elongation complex subunit 2-like [Dinoponera quadriceps]
MEKFKLINWNPSLENVIDDQFIKDDRIEKDSAMYKIMNGIFTDPFHDIENDYTEINSQSLGEFGKSISDLEDVIKDEENEIEDKNKIDDGKGKEVYYEENIKDLEECMKKQRITNNKNLYIPGMRKQPSNFPRISSLTYSQQAMCSRVLSQLFRYQTMSLSEKEKMELENYMVLQEKISAEQNEFLQFAKQMWKDTIPRVIQHKIYIDLKWDKQLFELKKLPRYYMESSNIPFLSNKNITVKFLSCLQESIFSEVVLPKFDKPYFLRMKNTTILKKYPPILSSFLPHFKLPVSEDTYCRRLAEETKVDLIISSSGLKCLLNNIGSDCSNSWIIPVIIRSHHEKNVVYIDKKLPPVAATSLQKNSLVYKYILRHNLMPTDVESSKGISSAEKNKAELELCEKSNGMISSFESHNETDLEENPSSSTDEGRNVTYKLFTIGPVESENQSKLMKDLPKEYQILIRTKTDGIEVLPNEQVSRPLMLAPKLEHQLALGAEAATLEEGVQQWGSLVFRPGVSLARVRIAVETGEVIQIERHTAMSLSAEMKRLYNVKVEDSLTILHNVIERLSCLTPGRYVVQHIAQHGPFAYIYKEAEEGVKNSLDLHSFYESTKFKTIPVTPWPPIDTMLMTPALEHFHKMPAMFKPRIDICKSFKAVRNTSGVVKRTKKNSSTVEQTVLPVRRSLREKKPSKKLTE